MVCHLLLLAIQDVPFTSFDLLSVACNLDHFLNLRIFQQRIANYLYHLQQHKGYMKECNDPDGGILPIIAYAKVTIIHQTRQVWDPSVNHPLGLTGASLEYEYSH